MNYFHFPQPPPPPTRPFPRERERREEREEEKGERGGERREREMASSLLACLSFGDRHSRGEPLRKWRGEETTLCGLLTEKGVIPRGDKKMI